MSDSSPASTGFKGLQRVDDRLSDLVEIRRRVRQGCVLSPLHFNLHSEVLFREALDMVQHGIRVNEEVINNILSAEHAVPLAHNSEGLSRGYLRSTVSTG